ncbi:hypothetical protein COY25_02120 [Candidatus Uhrbacteria bacterium CG_4_10_14_0_2_um_filter_41_7]|uniref:Uncharacterized protein n=1 Tax=Candidatus Uhrbacteria bacterium CG_4_9_14_3_um_filter_41_35 TaxID=1975034 RepID=A0A2M7XF69_9BACT|nr:MAG: hypothetical protein COV92_00260 [Candidatus Uhrbacteria bacterium CG11_big_fil_rev_8_21_14_0_20_41_9]PIZ54451.1 MAG: hypothetical protein COY25_02120 [Candidatus Uhrbacteria bacterium CG_4_10_14_0_2_um_filter_41_7]PJA46520.1 MAG: hypothetical protein CO173_02020 [Candidatus Uhrbacteria bacterium CG_4_9_14_3_um_filter_41_35]
MYEKYRLQLLAVVQTILVLLVILAAGFISRFFLIALAIYFIGESIQFAVNMAQARKQQVELLEKIRILRLNAEKYRVEKKLVQNELEVTKSYLDATTSELHSWIEVAQSKVSIKDEGLVKKSFTQAEIQKIVSKSVFFRSSFRKSNEREQQ